MSLMTFTKFCSARGLLTASIAMAAMSGSMSRPAAAETRSLVISWFVMASNSFEGDCPKGLNPKPEDAFRLQLGAIGMPKDKVEGLVAALKGGSSDNATRDTLVNRGRFEGKPVNAFTFPTAVPDVGLFRTVESKYGYGFNLDGKEETGYEEPETKEKGVDNAYWKAFGCNVNHRGTATDAPTEWALHWEINRDKMPAWLISVTADDFNNGPATVTLTNALEHISRDANGNVRADSTFRVDPDKRWHNTLKAQIKNGELVTDPGEVHLLGDPYILTDLDMTKAKLRLKFAADGSLKGLIGGYIPWRRIYLLYGAAGFTEEIMIGTNIPGSYYALKQNADAYPDPKTGENTAISTAWWIEAVPAYTVALQAQGD